MKLGSLFSGIGGLDLGLERAGMQVVWNSEIEPFPCEVLKAHWPDVPNLGDITQIDWNIVPPVDVICGGFPCQDISLAGKGAGIEGKRSGLWSYFHEAIRILRPKFAVIENVSAITIRGLDRVLCDLAEIGYDAEWRDIRASDMGAPHRRERIFIVAYPQGNGMLGEPRDVREAHGGQDGQVCGEPGGASVEPQDVACDVAYPVSVRAGDNKPETCGQGRQSAESGASVLRQGHRQAGTNRTDPAGEDVPNPGHHDAPTTADGRSIGEGETAGRQYIYPRTNDFARSCTAWATEPNVGRVANGVPDWVAKLKALGNAVVPQCAEYVGNHIVRKETL